MNQTVKAAIAILMMAALVWYAGGPGEIGQVMARIDLVFIFLAIVVITVDRGLMAFKWRMLLQARGFLLPYFTAMKIYCAAMVWGTVLPTTIGADAIRVVSTSRTGIPFKDVTASVIIERLIGFVIVLILGFLGLILLDWLNIRDELFKPLFLIIGWPVLLAVVVMFLITFNQRVFDYLYGHLLYRFRDNKIVRTVNELHAITLAYKRHIHVLVVFAFLTAIEQVLVFIYFWVIAIGHGTDVGVLFMFGIMPLMAIIGRIPITVDGWGVYEGTFILVMSLAEVTVAEAFVISVGGRIIQTAACVPWWLGHVIGGGTIEPSRPRSQP